MGISRDVIGIVVIDEFEAADAREDRSRGQDQQ
jgi:hypothetical protein